MKQGIIVVGCGVEVIEVVRAMESRGVVADVVVFDSIDKQQVKQLPLGQNRSVMILEALDRVVEPVVRSESDVRRAEKSSYITGKALPRKNRKR